MEKYTNITQCRLCKSEEIKDLIIFGEVPLANAYPKESYALEEKFPLSVVKCSSCGHVQLKETVDPRILFSNYLYSSSDSPSLIKHFFNYAREVKDRFNPVSVLEIGSNDGILLRELAYFRIPHIIGVEPAKNMAEKSRSIIGVNVFNEFFSKDIANELSEEILGVDVICANNVFAHIANLDEVMHGVNACLTKDGVFIFENAYLLDTIKGLYFDQVYHEHLQYYAISPLVKYLARFGMEIFDIKRVSTQGGSFRIFAKNKDSSKHQILPSVASFLQEEEDFKLFDDSTYDDFKAKIFSLKEELGRFVKVSTANGKTISCYGCPAKFALFSSFFELDRNIIKYVVDDSPLKQGRYSPGKKIPIVSRAHFLKNPTDYCIISAWNMWDSIYKNNKNYTGHFIVPMPRFKLL